MKWRGNIDMQGEMRIINLPAPTTVGEPVSLSYLESSDISITGVWDFSNGSIILPQGTSTPTGSTEGQIFWDTDDDSLYIWNGSSWANASLSDAFTIINCPAGTDPVANGQETLNLTSGNNILTITGNSSTDTVDFTINEGSIDHDALLNFVANEHIDWTNATQDFLTTGDATVGWNFSSPYTMSIQSNTTQTWLEILNNAGANKGVFFGILNNDFELYNWQAGNINFYTYPTASNGVLRMVIYNDGTVRINNLGAGVVQSNASGDLSSSQLDHGALGGLGDDDHPQYSEVAQDESITAHWSFNNGKLRLPQGTVLPSPAADVEGDIYWDTDDDTLYVHNGTNWTNIQEVGGNTLDDAYDQGGAGAGRTITADTGPVVLNATSQNYAPLELTNQASVPSSSLSAGQIAIVDNILYTYDGTRSKWLSPSKIIGFGQKGNADGQYLRGPGNLSDAASGWPMMRNGTILAISAVSSGGNATKSIRLRINGNNAKNFSLSGGAYNSTNDNINFNTGDYIQLFVRSAGSAVTDLAVSVEIAWRI